MKPEITLLFYLSKSRMGIGETSFLARRAILASARAHNLKNGVTGALVFTADYIGQILEGSPDAVESTFERICRDPRHCDIDVLLREPTQTRLFSGWTMAVSYEGEEEEAVASIFFRYCLVSNTRAAVLQLIEFLDIGVSAGQFW